MRTLSMALLAALFLGMPSRALHGQQTVELLEWSARAPIGWTVETPTSTMRLAEFRIGTGEEAAEVVVYFFGAGQGGSVEANVERWTSQFVDEGGGPVRPLVRPLDGTRFPTTIVELEGTYTRRVGMGSDDAGVPGQRLASAVMETPNGSLFIQLHGPVGTVRAQQPALEEFLRSIGAQS